MAIQTRIQPRHVFQRVAIIVICLVFGLWGVYDYVWAIPAKQRAYERGQVYVKVNEAMLAASASGPESRETFEKAMTAISDEINLLIAEGAEETGQKAVDQETLLQALDATDNRQWFAELAVFSKVLQEMQTAGPTGPRSALVEQVAEGVKSRLNETGEISEPAPFDHIFQWAFMLCLPFAPWYLWSMMRQRRIVYTLDDDGSLSGPHGKWERSDIADIDMSRWMNKSVVSLVHSDGTKIALDDYVFKNVDLIAGAIASERYPEQWDANAKPIEEDADEETEEAPSDAAEDAPADEETTEPVEGRA